MSRPVIIGILAALVLLIVLQNLDSVETRILFFSFTMPRALLLLVMAAVGFVLGVLATLRYRAQR